MNQRTSAPRVRVESVIPHGIDVRHIPSRMRLMTTSCSSAGCTRTRVPVGRAGRSCAGVPSGSGQDVGAPRAPLLRGPGRALAPPDAVYVGEVGIGEKRALLRGARALLNPIRWREPFGLVMVEALSCGTPSSPLAKAAPGDRPTRVNGFLVEDEADMVAAIARIDTIDRADCRRDAIERFDARRMVLGVRATVRRVSSGGPNCGPGPRCV